MTYESDCKINFLSACIILREVKVQSLSLSLSNKIQWTGRRLTYNIVLFLDGSFATWRFVIHLNTYSYSSVGISSPQRYTLVNALQAIIRYTSWNLCEFIGSRRRVNRNSSVDMASRCRATNRGATSLHRSLRENFIVYFLICQSTNKATVCHSF